MQKYINTEDNRSMSDYSGFLHKNMAIITKYSDEVFYNIQLLSGNKQAVCELLNTYKDIFKDTITWVKTNPAPAINKQCMNSNTEWIMCFGEGGRQFKYAQFNQGTCKNYIEGSIASGNEYADIHKATFPIYLPKHIIENFSAKGGSVLDCFGGTGTTLIACEETGRKCMMMELEPLYCDVIIERWEKFTGKKAEKLND